MPQPAVPSSPNPATQFAPPERAPAEDITRTAQQFASEGLLCRLLDAIPDCVMILNRHRQIIYGNAALVTLAQERGCHAFLGQRPGEFLACQVASTAVSGCGTGEACRNCGAAQAILEALNGQPASHECRILSHTDVGLSALDLRISSTPLEWAGEPYVLLVAGDISPLKRRQVLERLFFHDILNTAGSIQGIASLLASGDATVPEMLDDLNLASESLVNEIKSQHLLVAAENNELQITPVPLPPYTLLEQVTRTFRNHPVAVGKSIVIAPDSTHQPFCSDGTLLGRVLANLIKNALEASAPGDTVTVGADRRDPHVQFWCHNPKAMPRDVQLQVFQRSFSTKGRGRGIGTYSIKLLTERYLRGHVTFASAPESGTRFTVTLPSLAETAHSQHP